MQNCGVDFSERFRDIQKPVTVYQSVSSEIGEVAYNNRNRMDTVVCLRYRFCEMHKSDRLTLPPPSFERLSSSSVYIDQPSAVF